MILVIDNFDSFVHNLARMFVELGCEVHVVRNDALSVEDARAMRPAAVVISPGPCDPAAAGGSLGIVRELGKDVPMLGVCLGHQVIGEAYGGRVVRGQPVHGRADRIHHLGAGVFRGLPNPFLAARYHSLIISAASVPEALEITAWTEDGTIMAFRHREFPVVGVQFHPESVLTEYGYEILRNFLAEAR